MKLSVLLFVAGISGLVWVCPALGETGRPGDWETRRFKAADLLSQNNLTRVTGVEVNQTESGLELILKTATGSERLVPLILPEGNDLVIDILDATLGFSIRNGVTETNPAPGINRITVNQAEENSIQVRITGENQTPSAEVVTGRDDLVLSIAPEEATTEQEADEEIEVIATGQAEDDDYNVDNASTATKTDTPLRDVPQSIQVVPQQVIEDRDVRNLNQITETVSGVVETRNFVGSSAGGRIIRGFVQDGNFRNGFRDVPNRFIPTSPIDTIEQVEVLKGPASVLFGDIAPGGIVNIITKKPLDEPFYELEFEAGNRNFYKPSVDLSGPITGDKDLLYRFVGAYQTADGFQDFVETNETTIAPSLTWKIGDRTDLDLYYEYANFVGDPAQSDGSVFLSDGSLSPRELYVGYPQLSELDISTNRFGYTLTHEFNDNLQIRNNFSGLISTSKDDRVGPGTDDVEDDRFVNISPIEQDYRYDNYFAQIDILGEFQTGSIDHQVAFGFDFNDFTDDFRGLRATNLPPLNLQNPNYDNIPEPEYEPDFDFKNEIQSYGVYLQDQIAFGDKFKLLAGGRYDWTTFVFEINDFGPSGNTTEEPEISEGAFSPRIGLVYQPNDTVALFTSFSRSFDQNSFISDSSDPAEPTRGTQYEIGVKTDFLDGKLSTTLAAYHLTQTNVVTEDPDNPDFSIQTGEQRSQGIELDIIGEILPGWNITAAYAYTDAEVTEDNTIPVGNRLEDVPENAASLWTSYRLQQGSLEGLGFGLGLFYVGERFTQLNNEIQVDDYFRTDAALFYEKGRLKTAINIRNLFDIDYVTSANFSAERGEPFRITGSVSYEF